MLYNKIVFLILSVVILVVSAGQANPQSVTQKEVTIREQLGQFVPLDARFLNEAGDTVTLGQLIDRPTVLTLVYYNCPGLCTPLLEGAVDVLDKVDLEPGSDFQVITISFNPDETPELAREKKTNMLEAFERREFPPSAWHFLVGDSLNIHKVTESVGFHYVRNKDGFLHPAAMIVLSDKGKITRYLNGTTFLPFDLKMAIIEASQGRVGPTIAKVLQLCFNYDPEANRYVFNFLRVAGALVIFFTLVFVIGISLKKKSN